MSKEIQSPSVSVSNNNVICLQDVSISNDTGCLLKNVSLQIDKGEFVYLIGRSGTGKTSLLRSLYGDYPIDEGQATVCGFDLINLTRRQVPMLRRKLGIVFQNFRLLHDRDVAENLRFVLRATGWNKKKLIDEQIERVLESVGLADKANRMPHQLSDGEQQRVGVARALINNPDLILADEPTGNLDPITSSQVMTLLTDINRNDGRTILVVSHDFMMIDKFPARVIESKNGTVS